MARALITGGAGFIGSHVVDRFLAEEWDVDVVDTFDTTYSVEQKRANVASHLSNQRFRLFEVDIRNMDALRALPSCAGDGYGWKIIIHLAARPGVRASVQDPRAYVDVNVHGTINLLELARERGVQQFLFASSSSTYGINPDRPWHEDAVPMPISPYAATKLAGEHFGEVYSEIHGIRFIALRLFTVYGPRQRPDLAIHRFTRLILDGQPIPMNGNGESTRDYTSVCDIVDGIWRAKDYTASRCEIINLGNTRPVSLAELVSTVQNALNMRATIERRPEQPGDVPHTLADIAKARCLLGWEPTVVFEDGVKDFAQWMRMGKQGICRIVTPLGNSTEVGC